MRKLWLRLAPLSVVLTLAGCIDVTTVVKVKKDGSGDIVQTVYMSAALAGMMGSMGQAMGGQGGADQKPPSLVDEAKLKADAAKMGEGVAFVSAEEVSKDDGSKGVRATYSFADITKVKMSPTSGMDSMNKGGGEEPATGDDLIAFEFKKGGTPELVINMPQDEDAKADAKPEEAAKAPAQPDEDLPAGAADQNPMAENMMRQMFDGMRIRYYVMVDGEIKDTNASHVEAHKKTGKKQFVTLMDIDFGAMLKDPAKFKKLTAMGPTDDPMKMKAVLKDFPEMKIETEKRVAVKFE